MTALEHQLPLERTVRQLAREQRTLASVGQNTFLRLFAVLVVVATGAAASAFAIGLVLDLVIPVIFVDELRALAALFPQVG